MALESINKALNIKTDEEAALILKGNILIGLSRFDEAITVFDKVISLDSRNKDGWKSKGYALIRLGRYREAVKCYDKALNIDDMDAEALHYKGLALSQLGEEEEAAQYQERAVVIEPSYAFEPGSPGLKLEANIPVSNEERWAYLDKISIECDWKNMSAESVVPGGVLESKSVVIPGGKILFTLNYENIGGFGSDPLGKDWARDVVIYINYTPGVKLVSSSFPPDRGSDNEWTIKNFAAGTEAEMDLVIMAPDNIQNTYFAPFVNFDIVWNELDGIHHGRYMFWRTNVSDPNGLIPPFDVPEESIFVIMGLPKISLAKESSSGMVAPGEMLTYSISYKNLGGTGLDLVNLPEYPDEDEQPEDPGVIIVDKQPEDSGVIIPYELQDYPGNWKRDVTIIESYPQGATFISADPAPDPGTNSQWTIKDVAKGTGGTIKVILKVPEAPANVKFASQESVNGVGFMRSTKDMTTEIQPYVLRNSVNLMYGIIKLQSATNSVTVRGDPGTELLQSESGSGTYSSEAIVSYNRETNFIREADNFSARYSPTVFDLPKGRSITYNSNWDKKILARNYIESESIQDSYQYANYLDRQGAIELSNNSTRMALEADFDGLRHLQYRRVSNSTDKGHRSTVQDISQDYAGSFKVSERIESKFTNRTDAITEVKKYNEPHITIYQRGGPGNDDPANLFYVISILNDGNCTLGPIYVRDIFPAGTSLLSSSISVTSSDSEYADWVFAGLPIGGSITIYLQVLIDSVIDPSINRVYATASYDGTSVSDTDYLANDANWLSCSRGECLGYTGEWNPPCANQCK